MKILEERIAALEEYCLNVDYTRFPVPKPLEYLFKKTTGTYEFHDNNPPVDDPQTPATDSEYPSPVRMELLRRQPVQFARFGGNGTIK